MNQDERPYRVLLVVTALVAIGLVVDTLAIVIGAQLNLRPDELGRARAALVTRGIDRAAPWRAFLARNLFLARVDGDEPSSTECQAPSGASRLVATWVADPPTGSIAVFTEGERLVTLGMGERSGDGGMVIGIDRRRVWIAREHRCERFELAGPPSTPSKVGVVQIGEDHFEVRRSSIYEALRSVDRLGARIVPSFADGRAQGFKIFLTRPDSVLRQIGIESGDVVQRIDGLDLTERGQDSELYARLGTADSLTVELLRRGKPTSLRYSLR